jgi:hypothetical protein
MAIPLYSNTQNSMMGIDQNPNGLMSETHRAVLYAFSPRNYQMVARRPLVTNFSPQFAASAADIIHAGSLRSGPGAPSIRDLLNSPHASTVISPTFQPRGVIRTDYLSDFWTFLLVVENEQPNYANIVPEGLQQQAGEFTSHFGGGNRAIYNGYFADEPVNPKTMHMTAPTINEQARMIITHKTLITQQLGFGAGGVQRGRESVTADVDIVDPTITKILSAGEGDVRLHKNTPDALLSARESYHHNDTGQFVSTTNFGESTELNKFSPTSIHTKYSVPKTNLNEILTGLKGQTEAMEAELYKGTLGSSHDHLYDNSSDMFTEGLKRRWSNESPTRHIGLQEQDVISIASCHQRYGNLKIQPWPITKTHQSESVDQMISSASNVYSSLFLQSAPSIMLNHRISDIMFIYDSSEDGYAPGSITYGLIGKEITNVEEEKRVNAFLYSLKTDLYPVLYHGHGHFHISVSLQVGGVSKCMLNFYDDNEKVTTPYEMPNIVGGAISNMIGDINDVTHNSQNLSELIDHVADHREVNSYPAVDYGGAHPQKNVYEDPDDWEQTDLDVNKVFHYN